jgi:hypothetical protein
VNRRNKVIYIDLAYLAMELDKPGSVFCTQREIGRLRANDYQQDFVLEGGDSYFDAMSIRLQSWQNTQLAHPPTLTGIKHFDLSGRLLWET